jgi:raffinose/stachyose/melibiose transport system substrate-binding protein
MKKKIVSALLCVAMAASLVVGCGSKSGSDSGSSKGGDKLVYWAMWSEDEPQAKVIKEGLKEAGYSVSRDVPDRERDLSRL